MPQPRVVVGLDFGTTFSGFAYAHIAEPDEVFNFQAWPDENLGGGRPYCKTKTALFYDVNEDGGVGELKGWGWSALVKYTNALQRKKAGRLVEPQKQRPTQLRQKPLLTFTRHLAGSLRNSDDLPLEEPSAGETSTLVSYIDDAADSEVGVLITNFKLLLAGEENERAASGPLPAMQLPKGLSIIQAITDYLSKISELVMEHLRLRFNNSMTMEEVQWCLTVPAIWDDSAKQKMRLCAKKAGMVGGSGSPHELIIVLEPEAASVYCFKRTLDLGETKGDQFLVVDVGGGTTDIVVHERISPGRIPQVREVKRSSGGLCGGAYVDQNFKEFLSKTVGGFDAFVDQNPSTMLKLQGWWELQKCGFTGHMPDPLSLELPHGLTKAWMEVDQKRGRLKPADFYEEIEVSLTDMKKIFDPVVQRVIQLMNEQMSPTINIIMVVGGFSASPYLINKIREAFGSRVKQIISPPDPGSAICHGAVALGIATDDIVLSRIAKKTYGIRTCRPFARWDPVDKQMLDDDGDMLCTDVFSIFARKGEEIDCDHCVSELYYPIAHGQRKMGIQIFSSSQVDPKYTTDDGVALEGSFTMDMSEALELGKSRAIEVSMFFGRASIDVQGRRDNFGDTRKVEHLLIEFDFSVESNNQGRGLLKIK